MEFADGAQTQILMGRPGIKTVWNAAVKLPHQLGRKGMLRRS